MQICLCILYITLYHCVYIFSWILIQCYLFISYYYYFFFDIEAEPKSYILRCKKKIINFHIRTRFIGVWLHTYLHNTYAYIVIYYYNIMYDTTVTILFRPLIEASRVLLNDGRKVFRVRTILIENSRFTACGV